MSQAGCGTWSSTARPTRTERVCDAPVVGQKYDHLDLTIPLRPVQQQRVIARDGSQLDDRPLQANRVMTF